MSRTTKALGAVAVAILLILGVGAAGTAAQAREKEAEVERMLEPEVEAAPSEALKGPEGGLIVFSADARVDGHRVNEELYLALGYHDRWPFLASLWLLVDAENDEWVPICIGFLLGDDEGALFVGESTLGDEDDGCLVVPLGDEEDDSGVVFGAIELEGDSVATAAMYVIG